jgi:hypothetical protein
MTIAIEGSEEAALRLERMLFDAGCHAHALPAASPGAALAEVCRALNDAGVIAVVYGPIDGAIQETVREKTGADHFLQYGLSDESPAAAAARIYGELEEAGVFFKSSTGD